ncbi:MAG: 4-alpha-glucanotransferase [Actinobacteria bacterium]|nr:4-alpha-glucanotransferase [Actinomycetota bacterium]
MGILNKRSTGILLHITSLPSGYGIGDLGPAAYGFADFLSSCKQSYWQVLPLNPTKPEDGNSPYSSSSAFAGNKLLISPELLAEQNFLEKEEIEECKNFRKSRADYEKASLLKNRLHQKAFNNFNHAGKMKKYHDEFEEFCSENDKKWLDDHALFNAFNDHFKSSAKSWNLWPGEIRDREKGPVNNLAVLLRYEIEKEKFLQYIFFKQWSLLKKYLNSKNIKIIGDMPLYVDFNSSDVWANSKFFKLDNKKNPLFVSGVPPDYYSMTGQLWKNPVYDWDESKKDGFKWWIKRLEHNFKLFDLTRIDHFRGLIAYWEINSKEKNAINGKWVKAYPGDFLSKLSRYFMELPVIAEDLGVITADVRDILTKFHIAGTKVLLFAFGNDFPKSPYLPHNYPGNCVAYTGTHDNNTIKGWFSSEAGSMDKKNLSKYLGKKINSRNVHLDMIRLLMESAANLTIIPLQDILGLGKNSRMNFPSTLTGNWEWQFSFNQISPFIRDWLPEQTEIFGR